MTTRMLEKQLTKTKKKVEDLKVVNKVLNGQLHKQNESTPAGFISVRKSGFVIFKEWLQKVWHKVK